MQNKNIIKIDSLNRFNNSMYTHLVSSDDYGLHSHEFIEIFYITNGSIEHNLGGSTETLTIGDMLFIMPGNSHAFLRPAECTHRDIIFQPDYFYSICDFIDQNLTEQIEKYDFSQKIKISPEQITCLENILDEYNCNFLNEKTKCACLSNLAATTLINIIIDSIYKKKLTSLPVWFTKIIDRFQSIESISQGLPAILDGIPYNHIYINKIFKKYYGQSLSSYLNDVRLKYAELALRTTSESVNNIIESCGFSSPTFFFNLFKKKYGTTPNKYRNQMIRKH